MTDDATNYEALQSEVSALRTRLAELEQQVEDLRKREEMYSQALDAVQDLVLIKGPQSRIIYANRAFRELYGMTQEQLLDLIDAPFNEPDYTQQYIRDDAYVFTTGEVLDIPEEPVTRYDGEVRLLHTVKSPIRSTDGQVIMTVGISHDITDSKHAEEALRQNIAQEETLRAQAAALAELSTPLIPINDQVVVMPLIGSVDSGRAQQVIETLLHGISTSHAQVAILDITGVPVVDTQVANALLRAAQAVRLLGAQIVLSGIRPEVAQTLIGLGTDLRGIMTHSTLQSSIAYAIGRQ